MIECRGLPVEAGCHSGTFGVTTEAIRRAIVDLQMGRRVALRRTGTRPEIVRHPDTAPSSRPHVSVIVPAYNYARYLTACVESIVSQPGVTVDVLVIDDCSTDETPSVTAALAQRHRCVRVIRHEHNRGHIDTYNEGLLQIDAPYSVLMDADDILPSGALARATALLEAHPEVGFAYGRPVHFIDEPPARFEHRGRVRSWSVWSGHDWIARCCSHGYNVVSNPEVVMRTEVMRDCGGFKRELPHTGDLELWLQLAARADVGRVNGPAQGYYRVHATSMQRTIYKGVLVDLQGRRDAFEYVFSGPAKTYPDSDELHSTARRALASQALDRACHGYDRGHPLTGDHDIEALVAFALETWPDADRLPEWRALGRRQRVGPKKAPRKPAFVSRAVMRRAAEEVRRLRWQHTGQR